MKNAEKISGIIFHEIGYPCIVKKADGRWYRTSNVVAYSSSLGLLETQNTIYQVVPERELRGRKPL